VAQRTVPGTNVALTIAGSDSGGGAGIQADLKTFSVMRVFGATAITAITAQNTTGVKQVQPLEADLVAKQIDTVAGDLNVIATKTGMLASRGIIQAVAAAIKRNKLAPLVVDPVMIAKSGDSLIDDDAVDALRKQLLPLAALVTPNRHEAAKLLGQSDPTPDLTAAKAASREICKRHGVRACIVKGFRRNDDKEGEAVDIYFDGTDVREVASAWRPTDNTHGSGCVFSAAITAGLAQGKTLDEAITQAKQVIAEAIRQCTGIGHGISPVNPIAWLDVD
jgi:hydroxymethylpyrimidine/phosphomethylpyrimidine kinase